MLLAQHLAKTYRTGEVDVPAIGKGQQYFYFRAQQKDALDIVYFQPAVTAILNWQDRSYQVTPENSYTGIRNLELRARLFLLNGGVGTEFGEKQASSRLEVYARYYF